MKRVKFQKSFNIIKITFIILFFLIFDNILLAQKEKDGIKLKKDKKVGLVLSGGGAKGFAHIGVLKVLEEENITIDYITGTSMGALIGALYSIGYSPEEIEDIVLNQEWSFLTNENIESKNMSMRDKLEYNSPIKIPIRDWNIEIPAGLIEGQKIETFLHDLTWGKFGEQDFTQFPIPFKCVATDLEKGEQVILSKGNLVKSLRASISIPTVFTPISYKNKILVDGMLVNNFPVREVVEMGSDFVIGVDVGQELYTKEKLDSVAKILEQSFNIKGALKAKEQRKLTDILIVPNLQGYNSMSYNSKKEIIELGEKQAREEIFKAKQNLDFEISKEAKEKKTNQNSNIQKSYLITKIDIRGNEEIPKKEILDMIEIELPFKITKSKINKIVNDLYTERQFKKVSYSINNDILLLEVKENGNGFLELGGNYNDHTKASIYAKIKNYNQMNFKDISQVALKLGEYPELKINYTQTDVFFDSLDIDYRLEYANIPIYIYEDRNRVAKFDFSHILTKTELILDYWDFALLLLGGEAKTLKGEPVISSNNYDGRERKYISQYINLKIDTTENLYFSSSGLKLDAKIESGYPYYKYNQLIFKSMNAKNINKKMTLKGRFKYGKVNGIDYPESENIFLGGSISFFDSHFKFKGLENMEIYSDEIKLLNLIYQYEFKAERFFSIFLNKAWYNEQINQTNQKNITSFGIELGSRSGIGPIKLNLARNIEYNRYIGYLNIGYKF